MQRVIAALLVISALAISPVNATPDDADELVLLPGQGEFRERSKRNAADKQRLKPGGGLFISFDQDANGIVSTSEISTGIPVAFIDADANSDGVLTAIEQQAWAERLPTRDDSLANPVRFDPNLDRQVSLEEFQGVIETLGAAYADEETGNIAIADLKVSASNENISRPSVNERSKY
ncbi:MAG: hypothetical protein Hens3KO_00590 [Henriciella sp.]